ncbi:MAG TPA: PIN domain-containing protein [Phototrophicaceae bacterium]|nr:PIN domain-containing protein [Phototrophicaceae bacterium]
MVVGLLDTSVVIDLLRQHSPADRWLAQQGQLGITRIVWLEVIEGAQSRYKQEEALKLLKRFDLVELTTSDLAWATEQLIRLRLNYEIDSFDCIIASASYRLQFPLYTTNLKHFTPLLGKLAQAPY